MNEYGGSLDQFTRRQEVKGPRDGYRGGRLGECSGVGKEGIGEGGRTSPVEDSIDVPLFGESPGAGGAGLWGCSKRSLLDCRSAGFFVPDALHQPF